MTAFAGQNDARNPMGRVLIPRRQETNTAEARMAGFAGRLRKTFVRLVNVSRFMTAQSDRFDAKQHHLQRLHFD